jgi:hypothetical protein
VVVSEISPETGVVLFSRNKVSLMKQVDLRDMFQRASIAVVSPDPSAFHMWRCQKTWKGTLMTLKQQMKETSKWNILLIICEAQV